MEDFFDKAVENTLKNEGGYVNDPNDPGGETNFGISKRSYPDLDIKTLTRTKAKAIYYRDYWLPAQCDRISDFNLANKIFDLSVNTGISRAIILLQRALRYCGQDIREDGIPGPKTLGAVEDTNPAELLYALKAEAARYYRMLCRENPNLTGFLNGWLNRAYA